MNAKFCLYKLTSDRDRMSGSAAPEALLVIHTINVCHLHNNLWSPNLSTFTDQETEAQKGTLPQIS